MINNANKIDVKSSALAGQRVIKLTQNGEDIFLPVGLSALTPNGGSGNSNVKFGYWTEDGKFQEIDLSGDAPVDAGSPIAVDAVTFKTGKDTPDYGTGGGSDDGESEDKFYMATSFSGVLREIEVTAGNVESYMYEFPISLVGKYAIVDPGASGTDRKWVCNATTAGENQESAKVYLRTFDIWAGYDDNDNEIYEKRWGFSTYDDSSSDSSLIYSKTYTGESPLSVTEYYTGGETDGYEMPVFAPAGDEPPYGPTAWNGKRMTWQEREIYFVYGAGIPDANGYWVREDGNGVLTPESTFVNINGKSRLALASASGSRYYWQLNVDGYKNPAEYYQPDGSAYAADNIQNPFSAAIGWLSWSDSYRPVPSLAHGTEGYYFEDTETVGLPIKKNAPAIGSIYNSDATVRIAAMYPAK